jgi:hypothetical protein
VGDVAADAERGEQFEKQLGVWESLKMYKRVGCSTCCRLTLALNPACNRPFSFLSRQAPA